MFHSDLPDKPFGLHFPYTVKLNGINAKNNNITVSGLSAGAFMAVQLHIAFSKQITGVGIIAGGQYNCSEGNTDNAVKHCMKGTSFVNYKNAIEHMNNEFHRGRIDNPINLKDDKIFLFSGQNDILIETKTMKELKKFYQTLINNEGKIVAEFSHRAGHGFPTLNYGKNCTSTHFFNSPWLLNCDYDAAGIILKTLHGDLKNAVDIRKENLIAFDQTEFTSYRSSMGAYGYVYIPSGCKNNACPIHIVLHGCDQDPQSIGDIFVTTAGYNRHAEANNIIILYPSAKKNYFAPKNPLGCFDWWGYTGSDYHVKSGAQMRPIMQMVERLSN